MVLSYFLPAFLLTHAFVCAQSLDAWPENFVLARANTTVSLQCKSGHQHVTWKDDTGQNRQNGPKTLTFPSVDQPDAGLYTCWSEGKMVDSVYLFIDESEYDTETAISCTSDSYLHHSMNCSWVQDQWETPDTIRAKAEGSDSHDARWVNVLLGSDGKANFELQIPTSCQYGDEESFTVHLQAINDRAYISSSRTMRIGDIIKPGLPENVSLSRQGHTVQVTWKYPTSWAASHSYFPLLFQLEQRFANNSKAYITVEGESWKTRHGAVKAIRLRCQDLFHNSTWSGWTDEIQANVPKKKIPGKP